MPLSFTSSTAPAADRLLDRLAVDVKEAGQMLGLSGETIARAIRAGELPAAHFGRAVRVRIEALAAWAKSKEISTALATGSERAS